MSDTLLTLGRTRVAPPRAPVLLLSGFRAFFLLAAVVGAVSVLVWMLVLIGAASPPNASVDLHVHEMIFGFTVAVIAGFLLTAVKTWTGIDPAPPRVLAGLVALFVVGRLAIFLEVLGVARGIAIVEVAFLPALALAVGRPIVRAKNVKNAGVFALVVLLTLVDIGFHVAMAGSHPGLSTAMRVGALLVPCALIAVIGGRIIPLFTRNVVDPQGTRVRTAGRIDTAALIAVVIAVIAAVVAALFSPSSVLASISRGASVVAGVLLVARMHGWASLETLRHPILWILHLGYALLGGGFLLRGLPAMVPATIAVHVLAIGAIAVMCFGMMTRVALGHTGRALVVPRSAVAAYATLVAALVARVIAAFFPSALVAAALLFALACTLFLVGYARVLVSPRVDGKPG